MATVVLICPNCKKNPLPLREKGSGGQKKYCSETCLRAARRKMERAQYADKQRFKREVEEALRKKNT